MLWSLWCCRVVVLSYCGVVVMVLGRGVALLSFVWLRVRLLICCVAVMLCV